MISNNEELNHDFFNHIDNILKIIQATSELFISVHLFDLKENKLIPIKTNERIRQLSENFSSAQEIVSFVMENVSAPETLDSIKEFTTLETLPERLKDKKMLSQMFQGKYLGWCNTMFVKLDEEVPLRYVLCIVENVDKDVKRIKALRKTKRENSKLNSIVDALMAEYTTVCSVNLDNEHVEFLRTSERSSNVLNEGNMEPIYHNLINYYIDNGIYQKDRKVTKEFFSIDNLKSIKSGASKSLIYRNEFKEYGETKLIRTGKKYVLIGFSEQKKRIEEMKEIIFTDSLTKVKNRKYYDEELVAQKCQGLVMADIDYFKTVNDTYGHQVGDQVLMMISKALKSCVRKTDEIIRYGGDEFIISFQEITKEALETLLEKMREKVEKIKIEEYPNIQLSMSFGAVFGDSIVEKMVTTADESLYVSKENRNMVTIVPYEEQKVLKYNLGSR